MTPLKQFIKEGTWLSKMTDQAAWGLTDEIYNLGSAIKGIEIGVQIGLNSMMLLDACPNITKIIGIDPYEPYTDWDGTEVTDKTQNEIYGTLMEHFDLFKGQFQLIKQKSVDAAPQLENGAYDFLFIDGDHSLKSVLNDLEYYVPKVRTGGIIAGHDVGIHSVNMALQAWCRRKNLNPLKVKLVENQSWYWIKE